MISALFVSTFLGAAPDIGAAIQSIRRNFIEDGADRVSATSTHRVISHADGSLELEGSHPLRLSLESIRRERGTRCRTALISREIDSNSPRTVRAQRACALEETWTNDAEGLSHAFTLKRRPPGSGGLTLFVSVQGPWHHEDRSGQIFQGPGDAALLRYGNAFVVRDAERLPISVVHVEGGLELRVPQALVDAPHAFPMIIDPLLSAEQPVEPVLTYASLSTQEDAPAIAVNSQGVAMVVWADTRRRFGFDLFGATFTPTGTLANPTGIELVRLPGHQIRPSICAEDTRFLLAWETDALLGPEVRLRTVTATGLRVADVMVGPGSQPSLASTGLGSSLLAYVDSSNQVKVLQVLPGPTLSNLFVRPISSTDREARPRIAALGRSWWAAWERTVGDAGISSIAGMGDWASVDAGVLFADFSLASSATAARRPTIALINQSGGEEVFVYWDQGGGIGSARLSRTLLTYGSLTGNTPSVVRAVTAQGEHATLGYFTSTNLNIMDVSDGGLRSYPVGTGLSDLVLASATNNNIYAAWSDRSSGGSDVFGLSTANANALNARIALSRAATTQLSPHVALTEGTDDGLAVWIDGTRTIRGAHANSQNNSLSFDGGLLLAARNSSIERVDVAAAGPNDQFLVTWRQGGGTVMAQLATTSGVVDAGIPLTAVGRVGPAVAWDQENSQFVVVWGQGDTLELLSRTVKLDGTVSAVRPLVITPANDLDLACLRGQCLLVWDRGPLGNVGVFMIGGNTPLNFDKRPADHAVVAHDGTNFFVGWRSGTGMSFAQIDSDSGAATDIPGTMTVNSPGVVTGMSLASADPPVVVWSEFTAAEETLVYVNRLDFQSRATDVAFGFMPAVATSSVGPGAKGLIVYERYEADLNIQSPRSFGASFEFPFDAGPPDAGGLDAGSAVDAGVAADGGSGQDAGIDGVDGGGVMAADGGVMLFDTTGCGCNSASISPLLLFAVLALRRRRTR